MDLRKALRQTQLQAVAGQREEKGLKGMVVKVIEKTARQMKVDRRD